MRKCQRLAAFGAALAAVVLAFALPSDAAVPKDGRFAVIAAGEDDSLVSWAESVFVRHMLDNGYTVIDQRKMEQMRKSAAARAAVKGDVAALRSLGSRFSVKNIVTIKIHAGEPRENSFKLMTGTASLTVTVTSAGRRVYADTSDAKQVGYTNDEASLKAIDAAAKAAVERMAE